MTTVLTQELFRAWSQDVCYLAYQRKRLVPLIESGQGHKSRILMQCSTALLRQQGVSTLEQMPFYCRHDEQGCHEYGGCSEEYRGDVIIR